MKLKVATYNIQHAAEMGQNCEVIGKLFLEHDIDIIGIQEVDVNCKRSGNIDIGRKIADVCKYHYQFFKTIDYNDGDYGLAIISKYPITQAQAYLLSHCDEQRILVHSKIDVGRELDFLVTHFELGDYHTTRRYQFQESYQVLQQLDSFVLTGDFNVNDWTKDGFFEYDEYFKNYHLANHQQQTFLTYSGKPQIGGGISPLDNIITSQNIIIEKTYMVDTDYSDHDMLVAEINLN